MTIEQKFLSFSMFLTGAIAVGTIVGYFAYKPMLELAALGASFSMVFLLCLFVWIKGDFPRSSDTEGK